MILDGVLLLVAVLGAVVLAVWALRAAARRERLVDEVIDEALEEMDRRPEFRLAPPDWPIRESPGRGR